jgi:hypothetical protein
MGYCTECGAEIEGSETYCPECGSEINETATTEEHSQGKESEDDKETSHDETNRALAWFFAAIWIIFGFAVSVETVIGGILMVAGGLITIPRVRNRLGWEIPVAGLGAILILSMVGAGMMIPSENVGTDTGPSNTVTTPPSSETGNGGGATSETGYQIRIQYSGEWSGAASIVSEMRSIQGTGTETIDISGNPNVISANAQKQEANRDTLTIQIIYNGEIVRESQTDAEYGVASVTYSSY